MNTEVGVLVRDGDSAMEDSGVGSSCSSSVSDALPEPLDNIGDLDDITTHNSDDEGSIDTSLPFEQVSNVKYHVLF